MDIAANEIYQYIYTIRGLQVVLDSDLAERYQVPVKALKRAVRRNIKRFPEDLMFELTREEFENLRCQIGTSKTRTDVRCQIGTLRLDAKFQPYMPFAFTESGVAMLSSVLHSERAIQVNIEIMRAFVQLRKQSNLHMRVESLERRIEHCEAQSQNKGSTDPIYMIQNIVANHWGLQVEDLQSGIRRKSVSLARQVAIYLIRKHMGLSFPEIGLQFGRRDHTTILNAYHKISTAAETDIMLRETLNFLQRSILRGTQPARQRSLLA